MKTTVAVPVLMMAGMAWANPVKRSCCIQGFDISSYQPNVDFVGAYDSGARFVMIKVRGDCDGSTSSLQSPLLTTPGY